MKSNLIKILGTLGLIIAIAVILKSVFGIGKIGLKSILNKVSSPNKSLPILRCEIDDADGSKDIRIYDFEKIVNEDPKKNLSTEDAQKYGSRKNGEWVSLRDYDTYYVIHFNKHDDGIDKGYQVTIQKNTGEVTMAFPTYYKVGASMSEVIDSFANGKNFYGICSKIKRKNL